MQGSMLIREVGDELVVLDRRRNVAHGLDPEATAVWQALREGRSVSEIEARTGLGTERTGELLAQLDDRGLLDLIGAAGTRREVLRKIALAGIGLSAITSIAVPTAAQAFESPAARDASPERDASGQPSSGVQGTSVGPADDSGGRAPAKPGAGPEVAGVTEASGGSGNGAGPSSSPARRSVAVAGRGRKGKVPGGSLPFTGSDARLPAVVGAGLLAAGVATRLKLREPPSEL